MERSVTENYMLKNMETSPDNYTQNWVLENTADSISVVELGAGYFGKLSLVSENVIHKLGIEIFPEYIQHARYADCVKILGNFLHYRNLIDSKYFDTVLMIDALEHVTKEEAINLVKMLQEDFKKILLMIPLGNHPQKGNRNPHQEHKSSWTPEELVALKFDVVYIKNYHTSKHKDHGCAFAKWTR